MSLSSLGREVGYSDKRSFLLKESSKGSLGLFHVIWRNLQGYEGAVSGFKPEERVL